MGLLQLSPDECLHCGNLRRKARELYAEQGATPEWIAANLPGVLCPRHTVEKEARERREHRRQQRRRR